MGIIQTVYASNLCIIIFADNKLCYDPTYVSLDKAMDKIFQNPPFLIGIFFFVCTAAYLLSIRLSALLSRGSVPWVSLIVVVLLAVLNDPLRISIASGLVCGAAYKLLSKLALNEKLNFTSIVTFFSWMAVALGGMIINAAIIMFRDNPGWFFFLLIWGLITATPSFFILRLLSHMPNVFKKDDPQQNSRGFKGYASDHELEQHSN
jgi:hypothetical protein